MRGVGGMQPPRSFPASAGPPSPQRCLLGLGSCPRPPCPCEQWSWTLEGLARAQEVQHQWHPWVLVLVGGWGLCTEGLEELTGGRAEQGTLRPVW
jgi:hypothetical protein